MRFEQIKQLFNDFSDSPMVFENYQVTCYCFWVFFVFFFLRGGGGFKLHVKILLQKFMTEIIMNFCVFIAPNKYTTIFLLDLGLYRKM